MSSHQKQQWTRTDTAIYGGWLLAAVVWGLFLHWLRAGDELTVQAALAFVACTGGLVWGVERARLLTDPALPHRRVMLQRMAGRAMCTWPVEWGTGAAVIAFILWALQGWPFWVRLPEEIVGTGFAAFFYVNLRDRWLG